MLLYWDKAASIVPQEVLHRADSLDPYLRELNRADLLEFIDPSAAGAVPRRAAGSLKTGSWHYFRIRHRRRKSCVCIGEVVIDVIERVGQKATFLWVPAPTFFLFSAEATGRSITRLLCRSRRHR